METQDEEDQGVRAHLAGRRGLARRTGRGERLRAWRLDGTLWNPAGAALIAAAQGRGFDLLLGRRTYDLWAGFWPKAPGSPISDSLNAATKYVATHRPEGLGWGPVGDLGADILRGIRGLKAGDGPDLIVWGSTTLTPALFEEGLVDDVVLAVYPVLLGPGKRFFPDSTAPRELALVSTQATPTGVLINTYRYVGKLQSG